MAPSEETAVDGSYGLTRPLFIYLKNSAVQEKPEVADFAQFYVDNVNSVIGSVGYIAEPDDALEEAKAAVEGAISGESAGGASEPSAAGASESAS